MLELAILGLLKDQELHGYELKKRLSDTLGLASGVSFGSLYPALSRLEAAGAVKAVEARDPSAAAGPHTGSLSGEIAAYRARKVITRGGRARKVYGITERGEGLFEELLATENQSNDDDRLFNLRLAFARYLPPDARLGMLERRRAQLLERRLQIRTRAKGVRDGYTRSLMEHDSEAADHDLTWIERLIASERAGTDPDGHPDPMGDGPADATNPRGRTRSASKQKPAKRAAANSPSVSGLRAPTNATDT